MESQNYEDYWKITLEYSDINGEGFISTLKTIKNFVDKRSQRAKAILQKE